MTNISMHSGIFGADTLPQRFLQHIFVQLIKTCSQSDQGAHQIEVPQARWCDLLQVGLSYLDLLSSSLIPILPSRDGHSDFFFFERTNMPNVFGFVRILPNLDLFQVLQQILSCEGEDRGWKDYSQEVQRGWKYSDISNILML